MLSIQEVLIFPTKNIIFSKSFLETFDVNLFHYLDQKTLNVFNELGLRLTNLNLNLELANQPLMKH